MPNPKNSLITRDRALKPSDVPKRRNVGPTPLSRFTSVTTPNSFRSRGVSRLHRLETAAPVKAPARRE